MPYSRQPRCSFREDVPDSTGSCTWVDENTATCVGTSSLVCVWFDPFPAPFDLRCGNYGFAFNLPGTLVGTTAPALNDPRRRSVSIVDPQTPSASGTITFFQVFGWSGWPLSILGADSRTITIDGDTTGTVSVSGIQYDLGVPNELPQWFVDNNWHKLLYVGISGGHVGLGGGCNPGGPAPDCITVNGLSPPNANDKHAIVLSAGPPLTGHSDLIIRGSSDKTSLKRIV